MQENKLKELSDDRLVFNAGQIMGSDSAQAAQAELTRRNTEALLRAHESSNRYADKMMGLSLIVGLIAFLQLLFAIVSSGMSQFNMVLSVMATVVVIVFAFKDYFGNNNNKG
ncbi:MAG: hypothetical protein NUW00_04420 [Candidatus Kaiserbacteria bacterium]|nr:hypothetical protein [Candidatus Kaiserbacteria bacterium]